jgi:hypothetical protein
MSTDFLLSRHAFDVKHWMYILAMPTFYAIFHLFYTIANDRYGHQPVYFFMDASSSAQPAWIFGVLVLHLLVFFAVWAFSTYVLKRKVDNVFDIPDSDKKVLLDTENPGFNEEVPAIKQ